MFKASQLMERVSSALQLFYCFGESFKFTSRLTVQYLKTQPRIRMASLLWSVGKGKYFM